MVAFNVSGYGKPLVQFCSAKAEVKNFVLVFHKGIRLLSYDPTFIEDNVEAKTKCFGWRCHHEKAEDDSHWLKSTT